MFKTRAKKCEEEAKKDPNYVPTKDLQVDMSQVENSEDFQERKKFPWVPVIILGTIVLLMVVCIIVIMALGGPVA